jgi:DNA-binding XRE family transcriptional regulator
MSSFPIFPVDWNMERFAEQLKQLRSARKMTQTRLTQLLEVSPRVYNRWENGFATPHLEHCGQDCQHPRYQSR